MSIDLIDSSVEELKMSSGSAGYEILRCKPRRKAKHPGRVSAAKVNSIIFVTSVLFAFGTQIGVQASQQFLDTTTNETTTLKPSDVVQAQRRILSQQARSINLTGGRQKRPLPIEEESAAGGFIMRALASASSGAQQSKEYGQGPASAEDENHDGDETTTLNQERADATTLPPAISEDKTEGQQQQQRTAGNEEGDEHDGRIPIDKNRKLFATHDQLLNGSTKDEPSSLLAHASGAQQQQSSRAGMGRLAYASSILSGECLKCA